MKLPFIQDEMKLWSLRDKTPSQTCSTAKMGFPTDDYYLRDTILKAGHRQIWYRTTGSVKRHPAMSFAAQLSNTFMNRRSIQTCLHDLFKLTNFVPISELHFQEGVECRKSDVNSVIPQFHRHKRKTIQKITIYALSRR